MLSQTQLLNGENLQQLCDVTIISQTIHNFHTTLPLCHKRIFIEHITNEDIDLLKTVTKIFTYPHLLHDFQQKLLPYISHKIVLMTHNSDDSINESHLSMLNDNRILHMFSQNALISHPKLTALPIGLANSMWPHGQVSSINNLINLPADEKLNKIYVNVNVGTNISHRSKVISAIQSIHDSNNICTFSHPHKPHHAYLEEMSKYKWVVSPKGNGVDCHRLWEAMYAGCIALVDDSVNARAFQAMNLPIILIGEQTKEWNEITLEWLEEQSKHLKPINYEHTVLNVSWWNDQIQSYVQSSNEGAFILVYIGHLRPFTYDCVAQIKLWNPSSDIYMCISNNDHNKEYIKHLQDQYNVKVQYIEELETTKHHALFHHTYTNLSMNGFWKYTMERFFIVEECMKKYQLQNCFHLEIDNLIYFHVQELLPACKQLDKIMMTNDSPTRFIAGTCFINNVDCLSILNNFFATQSNNTNEMEAIMNFFKSSENTNKNILDCWPILPEGDITSVIFDKNKQFHVDIKRVNEHANTFKSIGDAAANGQYFGGIDPIHNLSNTDGLISPDCIFDVSKVWYKWVKEPTNHLFRLYLSIDKEVFVPITNLHIHSKNLKRWISNLPEMPKHLSNIL